jgi:hypothetical protein
MLLSPRSSLEHFQLTLRFRWLGLGILTATLLLLRQFWAFALLPVLVVVTFAAVELALITLFVQHALAHPEWWTPARARFARVIAQLQVLAELALLTWAVHLTGGIVSPLVAGYLLYLFANGLRATARTLALNSLWAAALLSGLAVGEYRGYITHIGNSLLPATGDYRNAQYVSVVLVALFAFILLSGVVAMWISRYTRRREEELASAAQALARGRSERAARHRPASGLFARS